jgi:hypothetical protein
MQLDHALRTVDEVDPDEVEAAALLMMVSRCTQDDLVTRHKRFAQLILE